MATTTNPQQHAYYYQPQQAYPVYQNQKPPPQAYHDAIQAPVPIVPFNRAWYIIKIIMRCLSIIFAVVAISLSAKLTEHPAADYKRESVWLTSSAPPAALAIIWDMAEFITLCVLGGKLGIHSGAHVALDLLIWMGSGTALGWQAAIISSDNQQRACGRSCAGSGQPLPIETATLRLVITTFVGLLLGTHFFLFVGDCVETEKRNVVPPLLAASGHMPPPPSYPDQMPLQTMFVQQPYALQQQPNHEMPATEPPAELRAQMTGPTAGAYGHTNVGEASTLGGTYVPYPQRYDARSPH